MSNFLPGTTIETKIEVGICEKLFMPMFLGGGFTLSQVVQVTGLEGYIIQNWVKRKFIKPPDGKKYSRDHLCRIFNINILKECFTLEQSVFVLGYINVSADIQIGDSDLYTFFIDALAMSAEGKAIESALALSAFKAHSELTQRRLKQALKIMIMAYEVYLAKRQAAALYESLDFL